MSNETAKNAPVIVEQIPSQAGGISALGSANAPIVYADGVLAYGLGDSIIRATLTAQRVHGTHSDVVVVAHLRMPISTARDLVNALNAALAMGQKPDGLAN